MVKKNQNKKLMISRKKNVIKNNLKKYGSDYIKFFLIVCCVLYLFRVPIVYNFILTFFHAEKVTGYVIGEKNYERRAHFTGKYTYSYEFIYNNATYSNNSNERDLSIGDTITIELNKYLPFINRISK